MLPSSFSEWVKVKAWVSELFPEWARIVLALSGSGTVTRLTAGTVASERVVNFSRVFPLSAITYFGSNDTAEGDKGF